jgi:serine/threonine protein kinase/tetratricopeptide (TPR) repeat protein
MNLTSTPDRSAVDALLGQIADEFTDRLNQGEDPQVEEYALRHPEIASILRQVLPALGLLRIAAPTEVGHSEAAGETGTLGDFRILREVGRGGMGVVYEAQQISLGRRVALKVLPFAATFDPRRLQRFHNEARAAACLHHPHIVAVYAVGCERAVNFYAMQFIDGQPLDAILEAIREARMPATPQGPGPSDEAAKPETVLEPRGKASTVASLGKGRDYFRHVAELMIQAAEALEHAHECGVLHRDIKPANLLVDERGKLWVADFGLAQIQNDARLTLTGDLVGTLRYMSPEQALAKRAIVDSRTDTYSLGATLYELLTLEPVFTGNDRQELLNQIAFEEPVSPQRHNKTIPADLETIILKTLQKNASDRYATAQELADDLRRFIMDEPIKAKRPSLKRRFGTWCRRHKVFVSSFGVALLVGLAALVVGLIWHQERLANEAHMTVLTESAIGVALDQADQSRQDLHNILRKPGGVFALLNDPSRWQGHIQAAQAHVSRARVLLGNGGEGIDPGLSTRAAMEEASIRQDEVDRLLAVRLEKIRMDRAILVGSSFNYASSAVNYPNAFREGGFSVSEEQLSALAVRVSSSFIKEQLVAALDDWAWIAFLQGNDSLADRLLEIGRTALPDPAWGDAARNVNLWRNREGRIRLVNEAPIASLSPPMLSLFANLISSDSALQLSLLRRAQFHHPGDFWLNLDLGISLRDTNLEEAAGYLRVAIALRPNASVAYNGLGLALFYSNKAKAPEAILAFQKATDFYPEYAHGYLNLSEVLVYQKRFSDAVDACQKAINLNPQFAEAFNHLGNAFSAQKDFPKAIQAYQKAIDLDRGNAMAYDNLGMAFYHYKNLPKAIEAYQKAIEIDPQYAIAHVNMGFALQEQGRFAESLGYFKLGHEFGSRKGKVKWPYPTADFVRKAEQLVHLDTKLPHVLSGAAVPADATERFELANLCQLPCRQLYVAATRFFSDAFAAEPTSTDGPPSGSRYNAACAAALAADGQGKDADKLTANERTALRKKAQDWLRADLAAWQSMLERDNAKAREIVPAKLQHWQSDPDFSSVRSEEGLAKLPETERQEWRKLWHDVEALVQRATEVPGIETPNVKGKD